MSNVCSWNQGRGGGFLRSPSLESRTLDTNARALVKQLRGFGLSAACLGCSPLALCRGFVVFVEASSI